MKTREQRSGTCGSRALDSERYRAAGVGMRGAGLGKAWKNIPEGTTCESLCLVSLRRCTTFSLAYSLSLSRPPPHTVLLQEI